MTHVHAPHNHKVSYAPASEKQIVLIHSLLKDREVPTVNAEMVSEELAEGVLSKGEASKRIDFLLKCPKKGKVVAPKNFPPGAPVVEAQEGYYVREGEVFKVIISKSSGKPYAKQMVVKNAGTKNASGTWVYAPGIAKELATLKVLTAAEAGVIGKKTGACMICGRTLTKNASIEAGIGPVCAGKL